MSVQLYRINSDEILSKQELLVNKEVDIVLLDNSVYHGIIKKISDNNIFVSNMIKNKTVFAITSISEIVYSK